MDRDPKKIVNTQEQNKAINPADKNYGEGNQSQETPVSTNKQDNPGEYEMPDVAAEAEQLFRIEGDDAGLGDKRMF